MNSIITNSSLEDIKSNIDDYIKLFLENGLVCFKKIYLSTTEQEEVMNLFGEKIKMELYIKYSYRGS